MVFEAGEFAVYGDKGGVPDNQEQLIYGSYLIAASI